MPSAGNIACLLASSTSAHSSDSRYTRASAGEEAPRISDTTSSMPVKVIWQATAQAQRGSCQCNLLVVCSHAHPAAMRRTESSRRLRSQRSPSTACRHGRVGGSKRPQQAWAHPLFSVLCCTQRNRHAYSILSAWLGCQFVQVPTRAVCSAPPSPPSWVPRSHGRGVPRWGPRGAGHVLSRTSGCPASERGNASAE